MSDDDFIAAMRQGLPGLPAPDLIQRGNEGIDLGDWTGHAGPSDFAPLPEYPAPSQLPKRPTHQREPESFESRLEREAKRSALGDVAFCGAFFAMGAGAALAGGAL